MRIWGLAEANRQTESSRAGAQFGHAASSQKLRGHTGAKVFCGISGRPQPFHVLHVGAITARHRVLAPGRHRGQHFFRDQRIRYGRFTTTLRNYADGWKTFILHRFIRIVPLYWVATTLKLSVFILLPAAILHSQFDIFHIVSSYLFIPTVNAEGEFKPFLAVGWTLYFEMFFYMLFALALYLRCNLYYFVGVVLAVFASLSMYRTEGVAATMFFDAVVLQFFFGMLVASTMWRGEALNQVTARFPTIPALLSLLGTVLLLAPFQVPGLPEAFRTGIPAVMIVLGVVWLEPHLKGRLPKILLILGDASYAIYLFHPIIAPAVPTILRKMDILNYSLCVVLSATLAIFVGTLIHLIFEKPLTINCAR